MKKRVRGINYLLVVCLVGVMIGGGSWLGQITRVPNKIVLVSKSIQSEYVFWETIRMGAALAAKEENIELEYVGPLEEKDVDKQIEIFKAKIEEGADVILLAASDSNRLETVVQEAKARGITLVMVDSTVEGDIHTVATNNVEGASILTRELVGKVGGQGEVIMINFVQGTSTAMQREEGYDLEIAKHSLVTKLPTMYTDGTTESAYEKTKEVIEKYPNIKGIIGGNQYTTEGICLAIEELGLKEKVKVVGFDSSDIIITAMEKGIIDAIVVQKPFNMGYIGVKTALGLFKNEPRESYIDTGYKLITPQTLYLTENQKLLYPIIE